MKRFMFLAVLFVYTAYAGSNSVSVVCDLPGAIVLFHEKTPIRISVVNNTDKPIPFIRDDSYAYDTQIWIDLGNKDQFVHTPGFGLNDRKKWSEPFDTSKWPKDWWLNPGNKASWMLDFGHIREIIDYASARGTSNFTARIQLGNNQWASSETLSFSVDPRSLSTEYRTRYKVTEVEYFNSARNRIEKAPFFVIPISGKHFLFDYKCQRICEVPDNQQPEFEIHDKQPFVSVSIPKGKRIIRYNLQIMKVEPDLETK